MLRQREEKKGGALRACSVKLGVFLALCLCTLSAQADEYKCYVTASDTLRYIVIVDFDSPGMAARAARHVWINNPSTGKVGVQDVHECVTLDKTFRDKAAQALEKITPLDTIKNPRK